MPHKRSLSHQADQARQTAKVAQTASPDLHTMLTDADFAPPAAALQRMIAEYGTGPADTIPIWDASDADGDDVVFRELACGLAHELPADELPLSELPELAVRGRLSFSTFMLTLLGRRRR